MMQIWSRTEECLTSGPGRPVRPIGPGGPFIDSWNKSTTGWFIYAACFFLCVCVLIWVMKWPLKSM